MPHGYDVLPLLNAFGLRVFQDDAGRFLEEVVGFGNVLAAIKTHLQSKGSGQSLCDEEANIRRGPGEGDYVYALAVPSVLKTCRRLPGVWDCFPTKKAEQRRR